ncbi:DUF1631 domain-containing protein [Lysobacter olei]
MLEELKRAALERLGGIPGTLYGPLEDALAQSATQLERDAFQYEDQAALWSLRHQQAAQVMRFRQQLAKGFDEFRTLRQPGRNYLTLGLLDEAQLDLHLAGERMAEGLAQRYQNPLEALESRLRTLAAVLGLKTMVNPLGPVRLATAFVEAFEGARIPAKLRADLFGLYEAQLGRVLEGLYAQACALLEEGGYGPQAQPLTQSSAEPLVPPAVPVPVPVEPPAPARQGAAPPPPMSSSAPNVAPAPVTLDELRDLLHAWRDAGLGSPAAEPSSPQRALQGRRDLRAEEVLSVASLLQCEPTDAFARAFTAQGELAAVIRERLGDGARRLGLSPDHTSLGRDSEDAIDLVAMVFEALFSTQELHERCRRLYSRLVLPYVKVALGDRGLFDLPAHPARKLLDAITEACAGNNAETRFERELFERAALVAQRIAVEYRESLAVFDQAFAELDALLLQQRQRVYLQEERAAQAVHGRERLQHARAQADAVVARRLSLQPLSEAIADFLGTSWRHHLVQVLLRDGLESARFSEAVALGNALVEVDGLAAQANGRALADRLLGLQRTIVDCLASSGGDESAARHGLVALVRGLASPDTPRMVHPLPSQPELDAGSDEEGLWLVGGTDTLAPQDPSMVQALRALAVGDWVQLTDAEGVATKAKIAWISPLTSRRMLVNERGGRVLVGSVEELTALMAQGRLSVAGTPHPFTEAMNAVGDRLRRIAA